MPLNILLMERQKGRENEQEDVGSYLMTLRKTRYWKLNDKALDRTLWRTRFGTTYRPVADSMQRKTLLSKKEQHSAPILSEEVQAWESSGSGHYIKNSGLDENCSPTYNTKVLNDKDTQTSSNVHRQFVSCSLTVSYKRRKPQFQTRETNN